MTKESNRNESRVFFSRKTLIQLAIGFAILVVISIIPIPSAIGGGGLTPEGQRAIAVLVMAGYLWIGNVLPVGATAFLLLSLLPLMGLVTAKDSMAQLANDTNFLVMGGFVVAGSMSIYGLDKRIAISVIKRIGTSIPKVFLGVMVSCAFLSMWMSNTVAMLCVLPIVLGIFRVMNIKPGDSLAKMFYMGLLMSAVLGGMSTIVGTPPNVYCVSTLAEAGIEVSFLSWMVVGTPISWGSMLLSWFFMYKFVFKLSMKKDPALTQYVNDEYAKLGKMGKGELISAISLVVFIIMLMFKDFFAGIFGADFYTNGIAALVPAVFLFIAGAVNWKEAVDSISWQTMLFFSSGLVLSNAIKGTGAAAWMANGISSFCPAALIPLMFMLMAVVLTQFSSNTAVAAVFLPVALATATAAGANPTITCVCLALASSLGFLTPIGTPIGVILLGKQVDGNSYIDEPVEYFKYNFIPFMVCFFFFIAYCSLLVPVLI